MTINVLNFFPLTRRDLSEPFDFHHENFFLQIRVPGALITLDPWEVTYTELSNRNGVIHCMAYSNTKKHLK